MKKFSIITICYNDPNLEETCKSIVNQTYQDFEWIVIDAGSNKKTLDIFEKYNSRIDYFVSEPDKGRYNGMNKGIKASNGKYLNFMNAGDSFYMLDTLKQVSDAIDKNPNYNFYYGYGMFDIKGQLKKQTLPENLTVEFMCANSICHQATFYEKSMFEECGLYQEDYDIISDWLFNITLLKAGKKPQYIDIPVAKYNTEGVSSINIQKNIDEKSIAIKNILNEKEQGIVNRVSKILQILNKRGVK